MKTIRKILYDDEYNYLRLTVVVSIGYFFFNWLVLKNGFAAWYDVLGYGLIFLIVIFMGDFFANYHRQQQVPTLLANRIKKEAIIPWIEHIHKLFPEDEARHRTEAYKNIINIMNESDKDELISKLDKIIDKS